MILYGLMMLSKVNLCFALDKLFFDFSLSYCEKVVYLQNQ